MFCWINQRLLFFILTKVNARSISEKKPIKTRIVFHEDLIQTLIKVAMIVLGIFSGKV